MIVLGIDPGVTGGFAVLNDGRLLTFDMPSAKINGKARLDVYALCALFDMLDDTFTFDRVVVEEVGAMPKNTPNSMFIFGQAVGVIHGLLVAFEWPWST